MSGAKESISGSCSPLKMLDFQLRAWAEAVKCIDLESELRFAISRNLKQAGIRIPFPQRDLHLRSGPLNLPGVTSQD